MELQERAKVCELIEAVIAADGVVSQEERDFLKRVISRFGLQGVDREAAEMQRDLGSSTTTLRQVSPDAQARVMALLVEAAIADGVVAPEERALLLASAASLGIEAQALEERISRRLKTVSTA